jgi:hypothetical protein
LEFDKDAKELAEEFKKLTKVSHGQSSAYYCNHVLGFADVVLSCETPPKSNYEFWCTSSASEGEDENEGRTVIDIDTN